MTVLRMLLLPLAAPSWLGCRFSNGMAAGVEAAIGTTGSMTSAIAGRRGGGREAIETRDAPPDQKR